MPIHVYPSYADLPATSVALFGDARRGDLFHSLPWLRQTEATGFRQGDRLQLFAVQGTEGPQALLPALHSRLYAPHPGARVLHFLQADEQPYEPLTGASAVSATEISAQVAEWFRAHPKAYDVVRISPLDPSSPFTVEMARALRATGHFPQVYRQPDDRFERVEGMAFSDYIADRPRPLRESLERNTRLLMRGGRGRFFLATSGEQLGDAWPAVRHVIAATPNDGPEESQEHLRGMMAVAAASEALRLGLFLVDDKPAAAQFWVISGGVAHCLRFWSGPDQRTFPLDDLLTQLMALYLIDADHVSELDFGGISEEFASAWAPQARQRVGIVAFSRHTLRGLQGAARHIGVGMLKAAPARLWRALRKKS